MTPHSLTMTMIGASLLWVGWFGFNAGSNLEANGTTALAFVNTMVATAGAALSWLMVEWAVKGKPSLLGLISGAVAGLVAVTPASGFAGPMGSLVLGLIVSPLLPVLRLEGEEHARLRRRARCVRRALRRRHHRRARRPAFSSPPPSAASASPTTRRLARPTRAHTTWSQQMIAQGTAVGATLFWSGVGSAILYKVVDLALGLRPGRTASAKVSTSPITASALTTSKLYRERMEKRSGAPRRRSFFGGFVHSRTPSSRIGA